MATQGILPHAAQGVNSQYDTSWVFGRASQLAKVEQVSQNLHRYSPQECQAAASVISAVAIHQCSIVQQVVQMVVFTLLSLIVSRESQLGQLVAARAKEEEILSKSDDLALRVKKRERDVKVLRGLRRVTRGQRKLAKVAKGFVARVRARRTEEFTVAGKSFVLASAKVRLMNGLQKVLALLPTISSYEQRDILHQYVGKYASDPILSAHMMHLSTTDGNMKLAILESKGASKEALIDKLAKVEKSSQMKALFKLNSIASRFGR